MLCRVCEQDAKSSQLSRCLLRYALMRALSQTPIEYPPLTTHGPQCSRSASAKLLTLSGSMYDLTAEQEQEAARLHEAERLREMGVPLAQERLWTTQLQLPPTVVHGKQLVGALAFNQSDRSPEAVEWRQSSAVKLAWATLNWAQRGATTFWKHPTRRIMPMPGARERSFSLAELAFAFELSLGPVGLPRTLEAGIGIPMFGVDTQQSVTDAATIHALLWRVRPSLIIELGTMCGGSAIFLARTAMSYNPRAKVMTFDTADPISRKRLCARFSKRSAASVGVVGLESEHWASLTASGNIEFVLGDVTWPKGKSYRRVLAAAEAAASEGVMIIDDASHQAVMVQRGFETLQHLVTPGSYYIVEDTRLDFDCAYHTLTSRRPWLMCDSMLKGGGPAIGVHRLQRNSSAFRASFVQDRSVEAWGVSQHPGGYLRRRGNVLWGPPPPPPQLGVDSPAVVNRHGARQENRV